MSSTIYRDGEGGYVALVAHGFGNELIRGDWHMYGLMHYCLGVDGQLEIFDGSDDAFYPIDDQWVGLDWDVVDGLHEAFHGFGAARKLDDEYYKTITLYADVLASDVIMESLSGFFA